MKKRVLSLVIAVSILLALVAFTPVTASAAESMACGDNLIWTLDNEGILTVSGSGDMWDKSDLSIAPPWESAGIPLTKVVMEKGVTSVGSNMFYDCSELESVVLPDTLTKIGERAFSGCSKLVDIDIPESVTTIAPYAFISTALTEIKIPVGIEVIEEYTFSGCSIKSLIVPEGVTAIEERAFENCEKLTEVSFPSTLTLIGEYAFEWCTALTEITIPVGVTTVAEGAFNYCRSLNNIELPDGIINFGKSNPNNSSYYTGTHAFSNTGYDNDESNWENGILYIGNYLIDVKTDIVGEVSVKDGIKYITDMSFYRCKSITKVTLPESAERIYYRAFHNCTAIADFDLNDNLEYIANEAFSDTAFYGNTANWTDKVLYAGKYLIKAEDSISGAEIKSGTLGIANYAFANCEELATVSIPETVKFIGDYAFYSCDKLSKFEIPENTKYIGDYAFCYCSLLGEAIIIPDAVTYLGEAAFRGCSLLKKVTFGGGLTEIKAYAFNGCGIVSAVIPDSVKNICNSAFYSCKYLEELRLGAGVERIGDYAFYSCSALEEIIITDSVTYIGEFSFSSTGAKSITIGRGLKSIGGRGAFMYSSPLKEFKVDAENPYYSSENGVLFNKDKTLLIQYPIGKEDEVYTVPDGVITIGIGAIYSSSKLRELNISDTVKYIEQEAVANGYELQSISLGKSVEVIGRNAFSNIWYLSEIVIPDSVKRIEEGAFSTNRNLNYVEMGKNVSQIGASAFSDCSIGSIYLPDTLESIGERAFYSCKYLQRIAIPKNVVSIGEEAFKNCTALKELEVNKENAYYCSYDKSLYTKDMRTMIQYAPGRKDACYVVPDGVENIGDYAFYGCGGIESIILPDGLKFIGEEAFGSCAKLNALYIPDSVNEMSGATIVDGCKSFGRIYYEGNAEQWRSIDFYGTLLGNSKVTIRCDCKYFTENTRVAYDGENTIVDIVPNEELYEKMLVVALYNNGRLTGVKTVVCENESAVFEFDEPHDEIKVLYWNDLSSAVPVTAEENIATDKWQD